MRKMEPIEKNIREQYQALGQFVEAFEQMVHEARSGCIALVDLTFERQKVIAIAFHHQVMTAKPLFEIMRAIVVELLKQEKTCKEQQIDKEAKDIFRGVLETISKEYNALVSKRNNLLHGTWFVGFGGPGDPHAEEFLVSKLSISKAGVEPLELPKNAKELSMLSARCRRVAGWVGAVYVGFVLGEAGPFVKATFYHNRDEWIRRGPGGDETLP
jgi:hypothetical protein